MLSWHFVTKAEYTAASAATKTSDKLYFISDTGEIYRGTQPFREAVELVASVPATPAVNKLYILSSTLEGKIYNGSAWQTVIQPVATGNLDNTNNVNPVTGKQVGDYVSSQIGSASDLVSSITWAKTTSTLTAHMKDGTTTTDIQLDGLGVSLDYNATTGALTLKDVKGAVLGSAINLDLERFVNSAEYDSSTKKIILYFDTEKQDKIEIPVGDLVDTYTAGDTDTIDLTVSGNEFSGSVKLASGTGYDDNLLQVIAGKGLYVAPVDLSTYMHLVSGAVTDNIATFGTNGQVKDSGKAIGGATLAATPDANTLATEAAVEAVRVALQTAINGKIAKMAAGNADEVVLSTAGGEVARSGKTLGGENFNATQNAATMATELGVKNYVTGYSIAKADIDTTVPASSATASDSKVLSEKAIVGAFEWQTTV